MKRIKIMVGMGSIDDYPAYVEAGADEIFLGYVPEKWMLKYGSEMPLNRREVLYYNVQTGSASELMILQDMIKDYGIPVSIAMNSLHFLPGQYPDVLEIIKECMELGYSDFIIADEGLRQYLFHDHTLPPEVSFCISGEYGEMNHQTMKYIIDDAIRKDFCRRIIFPRQTQIEEMKSMTMRFPDLSYEAFFLNEKCHFTGAYCNSVHCDELCHMCKLLYKMWNYKKEEYEETGKSKKYGFGETGCGLCALWRLRDAGITSLKIVSRGNATKQTIEDIRNVKKAIGLMDMSASEEEYLSRLKKSIFPDGCSLNCYYY